MEKKSLREEELKAEKYSLHKLPKSEKKVSWKKRRFIISQGKSVKYKSLLISALPQKEWQISIALSGKFKGAVARNHTKRIIREVFRISKPLFSTPMGLIVTVLSNPGKLDFQKLKKKITTKFL